ncbi:MAG TPA: hypothetical protein VJ023_00840 [Pyrinomonadaceae bacterium]|nr:hypothetical protein [Pyrinomonadaceae bacterium]
MAVYKRGKNGTHWNYYFRVRGVRYRGSIPEARTKWEAEQAELKIEQDVFEGRFGLVQSGKIKLDKFIDEIYMPWAKANKRSWKGDEIYTAVLKEYFKGKALCEISPFLIEKFKHERIKTPTKNGTPRAHASVRDTAASAGSRKLLMLLVGARGFEPPTSRSQTKGSAKM